MVCRVNWIWKYLKRTEELLPIRFCSNTTHPTMGFGICLVACIANVIIFPVAPWVLMGSISYVIHRGAIKPMVTLMFFKSVKNYPSSLKGDF